MPGDKSILCRFRSDQSSPDRGQSAWVRDPALLAALPRKSMVAGTALLNPCDRRDFPDATHSGNRSQCLCPGDTSVRLPPGRRLRLLRVLTTVSYTPPSRCLCQLWERATSLLSATLTHSTKTIGFCPSAQIFGRKPV